MIEERFIEVYYHITQSLLGYITDNMRGIAVAFEPKSRNLLMNVYLYDELTDIDKENIHSALSEAESMFEKNINYNAEFIIKPDKLTDEDKLDFWVFMKYSPSN
jgi:hypothetical protein